MSRARIRPELRLVLAPETLTFAPYWPTSSPHDVRTSSPLEGPTSTSTSTENREPRTRTENENREPRTENREPRTEIGHLIEIPSGTR